MRTKPNTFIVNYRNFQPIKAGLEAQGCTVYENLWTPTDEQLAGCVGYLVCMYDLAKRPFSALRLKSRLKSRNIPLIGWNRDGPWNKGEKPWRLAFLRRFKLLDIYASHTLQDAEGYGRVTMYLPNAADLECYNLGGVTLQTLRDPSWYEYDASFLGGVDGEKYPELRDRAEFLAALRARLAPDGIRCHFVSADGMTIEEQAQMIRKSRISLNYGARCDDAGVVSWGMPERCFGIPACGGFLLSDVREHAKDDFVPEKEYVMYKDLDDCEAKIRYYLKHFDRARDVAERACARVLRDHTYEKRAQALIAAACAYRERPVRKAASLP
jgi:spore maturation protein CgeB